MMIHLKTKYFSIHHRLNALASIALLLIISLFATGLYLYFLPPSPPLTPIATNPQIPPALKPNPALIMGFLPFWNLDNFTLKNQPLTHLIYAHLLINNEGFIEEDPGYRHTTQPPFQSLRTQLSHQHKQLHLSFAIFDTPTITNLLNQPQNRRQAISTIISSIQTHQATGVNLDFEPNQSVDLSTRNNFAQFVQELRTELNQLPTPPILTLDVYAKPKPDSLWDLANLIPHLDYVVIMAYDYHRQSSSVAAPNAPLYGADQGRWNTDIITNLKDHLTIIPPSKIILGIPFYGYQWQTTNTSLNAPTYPNSGSLATFDRVQKLIQQKLIPLFWDWDSLTPWTAFEDEGQTYQIHFDNPTSLGLKLDLVNQLQLAGVAIWALGYEDDSDKLWQVIRSKLSYQP